MSRLTTKPIADAWDWVALAALSPKDLEPWMADNPLTGVCLDGDQLVATDRHRIHVAPKPPAVATPIGSASLTSPLAPMSRGQITVSIPPKARDRQPVHLECGGRRATIMNIRVRAKPRVVFDLGQFLYPIAAEVPA